MNKPVRLIDDASTAAPLRSALQSEVAVTMGQDAGALKTAVLEQLSGAGGGSSAAGAAGAAGAAKVASSALSVKVLGGVISAAVAGGVLSYGLLQGSTPKSPAPAAVKVGGTETEIVAKTPVVGVEQARDRAEVAGAETAEPAAVVQLEAWDLDRPTTSKKATRTVRTPPRPKAAMLHPVKDEGSTAPASSLAAQLALYDRGREALKARQLDQAIQAFETYLERHPQGELSVEASLSLLQSLVQAKRPARAQSLAARLAAEPRLKARRGELLRVRAESLVLLGRCEEAAAQFEASSRASASELDPDQVSAALATCEARTGTGE